MKKSLVTTHRVETQRHKTTWLESGPANGPLMIFVHGWPEMGLVWRPQIEYFAAEGWRCVAPDMRGYGASSVHSSIAAYAIREVVADMVELHHALGGAPAVWVGHDWGSTVVWALAGQHAEHCRAVVNMCVPYFARGFTLPILISYVDRALYPPDKYPVGQWDYWRYHREQFAQSARDLEADVSATIALHYRTTSPDVVGKRALSADFITRGGRYGHTHRAPSTSRDEAVLGLADYETLVTAFQANGFSGPNSYYCNDPLNAAYAAELPLFGRLNLPVLFIHAVWDVVCDTVHTRLADPMRADCVDLTEANIEGGHGLTLERPTEVNNIILQWLQKRRLS